MTVEIGDSYDETIEYSPESGTYKTQFDPYSESLSSVIIEAIEAIEGEDSTDDEPFYYRTDTDALDSLIRSAANNGESLVEVGFSAYDYQITVRSDGIILFEPSSGDDDMGR